jgi:MoxR-like ATPase
MSMSGYSADSASEEARARRARPPTSGSLLASPFRPPASALELEQALQRAGYVADSGTALALWLSLRLERPLLVEGPAGVGKTELARATALALGRPLVRLQCYEGLDEAKALYEWDYAKQMLYTQLLRDVVARDTAGTTSLIDAANRVAKSETAFWSERFLIARPLLAALKSALPAVLLVDEVDRSDPEFEAFLLELLAEFQITIPELGTVTATHRPLVILTSNRVREMSDALRRRCLHAHLDYPSPARELAILKMRVPEIEADLADRLIAYVHELRTLELRKSPSIGETVDWARALLLLGARSLDAALVQDTLGLLVKHSEDRPLAEQALRRLTSPDPTG